MGIPIFYTSLLSSSLSCSLNLLSILIPSTWGPPDISPPPHHCQLPPVKGSLSFTISLESLLSSGLRCVSLREQEQEKQWGYTPVYFHWGLGHEMVKERYKFQNINSCPIGGYVNCQTMYAIFLISSATSTLW